MGSEFTEVRSQTSTKDVGGDLIVFTANAVPADRVRVAIVQPNGANDWCINPTREQAKHIAERLVAFAETGTLEQ